LIYLLVLTRFGLAGFVERYNSMTEKELTATMTRPEYHYPGLEGSLASMKWLWESRFAAVAGDNPGFEAWSKHSVPFV
jgi:hypothetical protein